MAFSLIFWLMTSNYFGFPLCVLILSLIMSGICLFDAWCFSLFFGFFMPKRGETLVWLEIAQIFIDLLLDEFIHSFYNLYISYLSMLVLDFCWRFNLHLTWNVNLDRMSLWYVEWIFILFGLCIGSSGLLGYVDWWACDM